MYSQSCIIRLEFQSVAGWISGPAPILYSVNINTKRRSFSDHVHPFSLKLTNRHLYWPAITPQQVKRLRMSRGKSPQRGAGHQLGIPSYRPSLPLNFRELAASFGHRFRRDAWSYVDRVGMGSCGGMFGASWYYDFRRVFGICDVEEWVLWRSWERLILTTFSSMVLSADEHLWNSLQWFDRF